MEIQNKVAIVLLLLIAISIIPLVIAEDNTTAAQDTHSDVDAETQHEIGAIVSPPGAEVRLLQLEKALTANILNGEEVVKYIVAKNASINVTKANKILDDMALLLDDVKAAPTNGTGEELAQNFVDLKSEAINLTQQFRQEVKGLITPSDRQALMGRLNSIKHPELDRLDNAIKDAKHQYNAEQVTALFTSLGIQNETLIQAVKDGTATKSDIKSAIKSALASLTSEQEKEAMLKLKEALSKKAVFQRAAVARIMANRIERESGRWMNLSQKFLNKSLEAEVHNQTIKSLVMGKISERAQQRSDNLLARADQLEEKLQEKLQGWENKTNTGKGRGNSKNQNDTQGGDQ
jgi:hypothetical protein